MPKAPSWPERSRRLTQAQRMADDLVKFANENHLVVKITAVPLLPLAMGHIELTTEVRELMPHKWEE